MLFRRVSPDQKGTQTGYLALSFAQSLETKFTSLVLYRKSARGNVKELKVIAQQVIGAETTGF